MPIETTRNAFAYVFAGAGKFCNASGPLSVPTESVKWLDTAPPAEADNRSLVLFDSGDEVVFRRETMAFGSCWFRVSRSRNRWHGTDRS